MLCRPARPLGCAILRAIVPLDLEPRQEPPLGLVGTDLTRYRKNHAGSVGGVGEQSITETLDPLENLRCRNACRQSEVEPVDESALKQMSKAPEGCLRLARAGLGLEHKEIGVRLG